MEHRINNYYTFSEANQEEVDQMVREHSAFGGFVELLDAKGHYTPTLRVDHPTREFIADVYDATQAARGDDRRAFRYGTPEAKAARVEARHSRKEEVDLNEICEEAKKAPSARLADKIREAKQVAKKAVDAPYKVANNLAYGYIDCPEKDYIDRVTLKGIKQYIADQEGVAVEDLARVTWKHEYFIEGQVDGAESLYQWINKDKDGDWDYEGWIDAREYWDVEITPELIFK